MRSGMQAGPGPLQGLLPTSFPMLSRFLAAAGAAAVGRAGTASSAAKSAVGGHSSTGHGSATRAVRCVFESS